MDTDDDITHDPSFSALHDRAIELARADIESDRDPQILTGELACVSDVYEDEYCRLLVERAAKKEAN